MIKTLSYIAKTGPVPGRGYIFATGAEAANYYPGDYFVADNQYYVVTSVSGAGTRRQVGTWGVEANLASEEQINAYLKAHLEIEVTTVDVNESLVTTGKALANLRLLATAFGTIEHPGYVSTVTTRSGVSGAVRIQLLLTSNTGKRVGIAYSLMHNELTDLTEITINNMLKTVREAVERCIISNSDG